MYSSLDRIDLVTEQGDGAVAFQTDHRSLAEIEAEPEISVLFALTRVLMARQWKEQAGRPIVAVVHAAQETPPRWLLDALGAVGAELTVGDDRTRRTLPVPEVTVETLVDRAFTGLVGRVSRRTGLTDPATMLRAVEAETLADPPDPEADEAGYWTRVLELIATVAAVIRTRHRVMWVVTDHSDIPFALSLGEGHQILAGNRARRFLADGAAETMFLLVASIDEVAANRAEGAPRGPILPSLRSRAEASGGALLWRPLINAESDSVPVIAYGNDGESTFGLLLRAGHEARADEVHAEALANIVAQEVEIEELPGDDVRGLAITGSFFATEKLLDPAFMRRLAARLGAELLAIGVPRRGLMVALDAAQPQGPVAAMIRMVAEEHRRGGSRGISPTVLLVHDGRVVGVARERGDDDGGGSEPDTPKKRGFFRRLFGR